MRKILSVSLVAAWGLTAGCALNRAGREEVSDVIERHARTRSETAATYASAPALTDSAVRSGEQGVSPPSPPALSALREYIVRALQENPEINAARDVARAKAERIPQVTALPDPMLKTKTLPEPVRTAEGDNFFILGVSQKLPVPEKLDLAGRVALEETRMALEQLQETRLRVIAGVKRAYFQLYVLDKSVEITGDNQDLLRGLIDVARAQVAAGRRSQDDVLRAQVELSNLEAELIGLRQRRVTAGARLNAWLNRPTTTPIATPEDFDIRRADLSIENLFANALEMNPALERLQRQIERDRQAMELAKLAYWPDFTIGFEWMQMSPRGAFKAPVNPATGRRPVTTQLSEDGSDNWAITFGFNLPIWFGKIEAGIEEARRNLSASQHRYVSARNRIYFQVEDALERVRAEQELAALFKDTIIPQARQTYQVSQASYMAGTSDFLYVIDNWRKWLVFTLHYHRSLGALEASVADLEQVVGLSLSDSRAE